ncbi:alpha-tocopherol transfer protein-like [Vanessa cardui]|uniref:alpha-tocopherol transfer protein-like n=1 Tax=Vanessa cardui TaxID=171605 RepID=UPI001F12C56F|nr:alpha-tocopherol transfer protein-like [Vanessa cardui]
MDTIPQDRILETKPDTLTAIRKQYNLDKPGQMKEAISILHNWVQQQQHFKKKDFSDFYYEAVIIGCKGSIERAKNQIDKICTFRTLLPQFFQDCNAKTDFADLHEIVHTAILPKLTDDHYRVQINKFTVNVIKPSQFMDYYRYNVIQAEYIKAHDYLNGFIIVIDLSETNMVDFVSKISPTELRQILTIHMEGYGVKIKAIHIISASKLVSTLVSILKQVLSTKMGDRINVHKNFEEIHNHLPKEILPEDFGGNERSLKVLQQEWLDVLSSEEHIRHMQVVNAAGTDENFRRKDCFNDQYAGMPGTFRMLSVD